MQFLRDENLGKIDLLLELIRNCEWHKITELAEKLSVPKENLRNVIKLLARQKIVSYNEETDAVALNPEWKFLAQD